MNAGPVISSHWQETGFMWPAWSSVTGRDGTVLNRKLTHVTTALTHSRWEIITIHHSLAHVTGDEKIDFSPCARGKMSYMVITFSTTFYYSIFKSFIKWVVPVLYYDWLSCVLSRCKVLYIHTSATLLHQCACNHFVWHCWRTTLLGGRIICYQ